MKNYKEYFKGKKVTMLGLGLLGRGLNDAKFLAECGADLTITDLKSAEDLEPTIKKLSKYKNIKYTLGEHRLEDFRNRDFILKAAGVPLNSPYIDEAKRNNIPVEMDESLFTRLASELNLDLKIIGITGTRGKTTTTYVIYEILKLAYDDKVHLGGNIKGVATLPLIKKVKKGHIVVMELSSWQLQGWGDCGISPHVSVFTNLLPDHLNYYLKVCPSEIEATQEYFADKAKIFSSQKNGDYLILNTDIKKEIGKRHKGEIKSKILIPQKKQIEGWKLKVKGEHNKKNILQAIEVAKVLNVPMKTIKKAVENFSGVEGRMYFLKNYKGIKIYNDTTATTPDATIAALKSLREEKNNKNIVLIMGGADKGLEMGELIKTVPKYCKKVILLAGTGTEKLSGKIDGVITKSMKEAVFEALGASKKGDIIILSPAFASFGMFKNEFDRGEQFVTEVSKLK